MRTLVRLWRVEEFRLERLFIHETCFRDVGKEDENVDMRLGIKERKKATDVKKYPILVELPVNPKAPYFSWLVPFAPTLRKEISDHVGTDIEA